MSAEIQCPKCASMNVIFSKKRGAHVCEDCNHEFVLGKPFTAKRIFISYGHDEHVSLAIRLRDDLKQRGHAVWFDAEHLHAGLDWESRIEQGLKELVADPANSAVLLLLTPHSVRRPNGYCLNEVAYAQTKGLRIIPVMVVETEPPLSICRVQWLDMRECIPIHAKEALYQPRYERLLKALEAEQLDFEGTQSRLIHTLSPIQFSADIIRLLKDFTGRQWVFAEVDTWLTNPAGSKIFWITGAPGVGKSAISAWVRDNRRGVAAFHFCDINSEEKRNPGKLVRSLVYQLSTQLPEYQDRLARLPLEEIVQEYHEAYTLFDKLLIQPLAENFPPPDRTVVILIDALDEATYQRQNEIVRFLSMCADKTPSWLRFLVTSRPEPEIVSAFQALSPYVLDTGRDENLRDLGEYLSARIPVITGEQTKVILDRSEGVFLYVRHVVEAVVGGQLSLQRLDEFPRGLGDVYQHFFQRQFGGDLAYYEQKIAPLLQPVLAAYEPLTLGFLKSHCGIKDDTGLFRLLNRLGSLFPASGQTDAATLRPFHRSIADWITDCNKAGAYVIAVGDGTRALVRQGWEQFERGSETMDDYFLAWLPSHLRELGDEERLIRLLKDFRYLMRRLQSGKLERVLEDYRELPPHLVTSQQPLELHAAFFREKAHILRRGNTEWPAHKILLQLAVEHADDSPLTVDAEQWLPDGRCDWTWIRRHRRLPHAQGSACLAVLEGHLGWVDGALVLPDGRILSWAEDGTLRIWNSLSWKCLTVLEGHSGYFNGIKGGLVLPDGRILSWANDGMRIWNSQSGKCHTILEAKKISHALALPDDRIVSWGGTALRIWDSWSGKCLALLEAHSKQVDGVLVLSDGLLLSRSRDTTLRIWDACSGKCLVTLEGHSNWVNGALVLPDGRILSWAGRELRIWDIQSGKCLAILEGHSTYVTRALVLSDDLILSWAGDKTFRIWDIRSGESLAIPKDHSEGIGGALVLPDGRILSWAGHKLHIWDGRSGEYRAILKGHSADVYGAMVLPDGHILSRSKDKTMRIWDSQSSKCLSILEGHSEWVNGALALSDGRILSWSHDTTLRIWDSCPGGNFAVLECHSEKVTGTLALRDGHILSWAKDKTLHIWDTQSGKCLVTLEGHSEEISGAIVIPDDRIVSWSDDATLRIWDSQSGECLVALEGHLEPISGALVLSDGRIISWSQKEKALRVWDTRSGACLTVLEGHSRWVKGVNVLSDGRILSWAGHELRIWDSREGKCLCVLEGHSLDVSGAFVLPDGHIVSLGNRTLRIWDDRSGKCLTVLKGHSSGVTDALVLPHGHILSWDYDANLRIWDSRSGECLAILQGHATYITGALVLPDGRILSWSNDEQSLRLWGDHGSPITVYTIDEGLCRFPELRSVYGGKDNAHSHCLWSQDAKAGLLRCFGETIAAEFLWHGDSACRARNLLFDGTMVLTQDNGQVCFLQLYHGNRSISNEELERMVLGNGSATS